MLGDDLALNAQQVAGVSADRELPVVWAVAMGSLINKAILVPAALAISAFVPWLVTPLLMVGGAFLCFEGAEKIVHRLLHSKAEDDADHERLTQALIDPAADLVALEKTKIKGAIRTDFILSAEIIVISLGTVATQPFATQLAVLVGIALLMTVGVYGFVAGIVKIDDLGLWLTRRPGAAAQGFGRLLLRGAPWLMKGLSVAGTLAMFLVGGGILVHGLPFLHHAVAGLTQGMNSLAEAATATAVDGAIGLLAGLALVAVVTLASRLRGRAPAAA